jgi:FlgO protein
MATARPTARLLRTVLAAAVLPLLAAGCAIEPSKTDGAFSAPATVPRADLGTLTYRAVDRLVAEAPDLALGRPVVVGSIVDVQHVDKSIPFGNLVADLARSRLVQKGVPVSELRLRNSVLLDKNQGEITLANDRTAVRPPPSATAVLTGTYAAGDEFIYVSLKLVSESDARIVGAVDFAVPRHGSEILLIPAT